MPDEDSVSGPDSGKVETSDHITASTAAVAQSPDVLVDSLGEYVAVWWQRLRGGESGAAHPGRPGRHRHHLPVTTVEVPLGRQPGQSAGSGGLLHPARTGRNVRPHSERDRSFGRVHVCHWRRDHRSPCLTALQLALVGRHHRRPSGQLIPGRCARNAHYATPLAIVRRHPRRVARVLRALDLHLRCGLGVGRRRHQHLWEQGRFTTW